MPSKKRITQVRFNNASGAADKLSTSGNTTRPASTRSNSPTNSRAANQSTQNLSTSHEASTPLNTSPTSPTHSSNASTPLTTSPHVPTFEYIVSKIFNKSLIASLSSKDAVLKEVRDCILTNNESRLKAINPDILSYWRDLDVRCGCVCVDERVAIPNVLHEALIDDIYSSHPGTWGMICMATHCWWPYIHRELIVKATECKPCTVIGKNPLFLLSNSLLIYHVLNQIKKFKSILRDQYLMKRVMRCTFWQQLIVFLNIQLQIFMIKLMDRTF